ncbi:diaminopimelate decarboxylase [Micromonospora phaseoli]|uniref:Diaminopimelate decarboxylase n=1 Tax=Micromonospora phaseoli TaxID=1144548 RepID=A0A1H7DT42_9ACTN|nr:alanine racemase [Micromonospora phaseoli]PZV99201.1 diaminopimelate decarboxylase [Micromonospora phaseoli]GIJ80003.1 diaminopimelate decarboxylase [Micromonospora phaseoli]SEK04906.1 diaminopimelate decarboxylase [Micromonospora phaseoli]
MADTAFDTPAYRYDLAEVRANHATLRAALPTPSRLYYSLKANPHPAIVATLHAAGCGAEISSLGELAAALAAGVRGDQILYTGPGKRDAEVTEAVAAGVRWFSVDSPGGLDQAERAARGLGAQVRCLLRVNDRVPNPGQGLTMTGVASQFGADVAWIEQEPEAFRPRPSATVAGFHLYTGSNVESVDALVTQFAAAAATARRLRDLLGIELTMLNLGGGFGAPFARTGGNADLTGLADRVREPLDRLFPGWRDRDPLVAFESGRFLTATAGTLLTRVLDVKYSHGTPVVVLESGINHLGGMSGLRRLPPLVPALHATAEGADDAADDAADGRALTGAIVAGPLCTPLDTWARAANLPDVRPGDVLSVPNVGAYGLSASLLAFLGHPAPVEVVCDGDRVVETSRLTLTRAPAEARENSTEPRDER